MNDIALKPDWNPTFPVRQPLFRVVEPIDDLAFPVVIAEDDPVSRKLVAAVVELGGFRTIVTEDGDEAMEVLANQETPCVAILDWMMPGMDGVEVCRRTRAIRKDVYIIMLTARASKEDTVEGIENGADDYMVKPYNRAELVARIRTGMKQLKSQIVLHAQIDELEGAVTEIKIMKYQLASARVHAPVILLVDDDSSIRTLFNIHLSSFGYRVLTASDGDEAMRMIASRTDIQVMIMDVVMPGLNGQALADKAVMALPGLEILFCSGYSAEDLAEKGIDTRSVNFLQKPYRSAELKRIVEGLLARN